MDMKAIERDVPMMQGVEKRTNTTGVVRGKENIEKFIEKCKELFDEVLFTEVNELHMEDHLDYTLYTFNRIMLHY